MITFENVTKHYNTNVGLENASVHIHKGDFVFLVGPSGAGKSTFIKLIPVSYTHLIANPAISSVSDMVALSIYFAMASVFLGL